MQAHGGHASLSSTSSRRSIFFVLLEAGRGANQLLVNRRDEGGGQVPGRQMEGRYGPDPGTTLGTRERLRERGNAAVLVPPEQRAAFARKAELFRLLAKLAAKQAASAQQRTPRPSNADDIRREIFENLAKKRLRSKPQARRTRNTGARPALTPLALRWRLFRLETRTFGRYAPLHARPSR